MGVKSFFASPVNRIVAMAAAGILSGCLSDGPNHTGGDYLVDHGLVLQTPLYKVTLPAFPVDSVWTANVSWTGNPEPNSEPNRLGDSVLLLGQWGRFSSQMRLGFDLSDTSFLDSLGADSIQSLKLSLGAPMPTIASDTALKASVAGKDSLILIVDAWALSDSGWPTDKRADSLKVFERSFLQAQDTVSVLRRPISATDTVVLKVATLYGVDSVQALVLPHLRRKLLEQPSAKWGVFLQLRPQYASAGEAGKVMLRLAGNFTSSVYQPWLLFGGAAGAGAPSAASALAKQKLTPLVVAQAGRYGYNYKLRYSGPDGTVLAGKTRGLHLRLDRGKLLDSIRKYLPPGAIPPAAPGQNKFDLSYFVPYAQFSLPIDTGLRIENGFALDMRLISDLDSLLGYTAPGTVPEANVPLSLDGRKIPLVNILDRNNSYKKLDSISVLFRPHPLDTNLRQVILYSWKDSTANDTVTMAIGESREISPRRVAGYGNNFVTFSMQAGSQSLRIAYFVNSHPQIEPNEFVDPTTGKNFTEAMSKLARFVQPGQDSVRLRATNGFQAILNRATIGSDLFPNFLVEPVDRGAFDVAANRKPPYPVLAEIPAKKTGTSLSVNITLYLFPLGAK